MRPLATLESDIDRFAPEADAQAAARSLLAIAEEALECWVAARGEAPTAAQTEEFRLLALHRQGARGAPSFNACRETCREIAYHYNLLRMQPAVPADGELAARRQRMMALLAKHLVLFVSGKLQAEGLGEFCCASRPLRAESSGQTQQGRSR